MLSEQWKVVSTIVQTDCCYPSSGDFITSSWTNADGAWRSDLLCMKGEDRPAPADLVALKDSHHPYSSKQNQENAVYFPPSWMTRQPSLPGEGQLFTSINISLSQSY